MSRIESLHPHAPFPSPEGFTGIIPQRLDFVSRPTSLVSIDSPDASVRLTMKADDETSFLASGNKVRKLEFCFAGVLERARKETSDPFDVHVFTCGGVQSNHARTTAVLARRCGFQPHLLLRRGAGDEEGPGYLPEGNLLINRLLAAKITWITPEQYADERDELMIGLAARVVADSGDGRRVVTEVIPEGASNALGCWGYVDCVWEILQQYKELGRPFPTHLTVALGSGGTVAGLLIGVRLFGIKNCRVIGFAAGANTPYFMAKVKRLLLEFGEEFNCSELVAGLADDDSLFSIDDEFKGVAYAVPYSEELELMKKMAVSYGIVLDPVYTGKAFYGVWELLKRGAFRSATSAQVETRRLKLGKEEGV